MTYPGPQPGGGSSTPAADSITTAMLQDEAVTEEKLAPAVVAQLGGSSGLVTSTSVTNGSTATQMQVTGLDLNTDRVYWVIIALVQNGAGTPAHQLRINGVASNLTNMTNGTGDNGRRTVRLEVVAHYNKTGQLQAAFYIDTDDYSAGTPIYSGDIANLTSIEVVSGNANGLGGNSYIRVYR